MIKKIKQTTYIGNKKVVRWVEVPVLDQDPKLPNDLLIPQPDPKGE